MATAEQIKSLIRSYLSDDDERFYTIVLQVAAHESQQGHGAPGGRWLLQMKICLSNFDMEKI